MKLRDVLRDCLPEERMPFEAMTDIDISGITYDSRRVTRGGIFVAIKGENSDGKSFIPDAIKNGVKGIIFEGDIPQYVHELMKGKDIFLIRVNDARMALACIANNFFERPSERLNIIGVTGTNGKTTTTHLIRTIIETWGVPSGLIGTISYSYNGHDYPAIHTTPEAVEFQWLLKKMYDSGCNFVVTEVSSHSLKQRRVDYTRFSIAVFTNLTRDHLDFHKTMDDYYFSKRRLFTDLLVEDGTAVINIDDEWGKRLLSDLSDQRPDIKIITYGLSQEADVTPLQVRKSIAGTSLMVKIPKGNRMGIEIKSSLIGVPNIYNILSALSVAINLNIPEDIIKEGFEKDTVVRGRLEKIKAGQDFLCIVDYAHTPDALERLILTARELTDGKVITVFGCGGNRDRGKRPIMGKIASNLSDYVIITSDNPRHEDPVTIIKEIITGVTRDNFEIIPDRAEAIKRAVQIAMPGDVLLIAGKGHEEYQEVKGKREIFSDRDVCLNAIAKKISSERGQ